MKGIYLLTNPGSPFISGDASLEMSLPKPLLFFQCLKETFSLLLWEVELPGEGELRAGGSLQSSWSSWSTLVPHGESLTWRCGPQQDGANPLCPLHFTWLSPSVPTGPLPGENHPLNLGQH